MARQIQSQTSYPGTKVDMSDLAKSVDIFYVYDAKQVTTGYGPTYIFALSGDENGQENQRFVFASPGVSQRDELFAMFNGDDKEAVGPLCVVAIPTKAGRNVYIFEPVEEDNDESFSRPTARQRQRLDKIFEPVEGDNDESF